MEHGSEAPEDQVAVPDLPLGPVALLDVEGLGEGSGDRYHVLPLGELLDANYVAHA